MEQTVPDSVLVSQTIAGERRAFSALVNRYERAVRATCLAVLRDHHLAQDAAQDAFVAAYRSIGQLRDPSSFGAWVITIARNRAIRVSRRRRSEEPLVDQIANRPHTQKIDHDLLQAVAALPEHERVVMMLRYFDQHDVGMIATMLNRPLGTVTKQLSRAADRLRRALLRQEEQ